MLRTVFRFTMWRRRECSVTALQTTYAARRLLQPSQVKQHEGMRAVSL